jgi:isoamylase
MMRRYLTYPGEPYPLGATWDGGGVNFALFSRGAERVELCLFDEAAGALETTRIPLVERTDFVWHAYLPEIRPGQLYGYRAYGPFDPESGLRFNPQKLLVDPYARAIAGPDTVTSDLIGPLASADPDRDLTYDSTDSAPVAHKGVVVDPSFTWGDDRPPRTPWQRTIIYEAHVRGFTIGNQDLPEPIRGTYAALADPRIVEYLQALGVTAIELLPVHQFMNDWRLIELGLSNYWGYNSLGFFAPHGRYSSRGTRGEQVDEFKTMVKSLHEAGIEVILDVVYNHTAEANRFGPTLSFRGLDNHVYYRLDPQRPRLYTDFTGTGNTLNTLYPRTMQLVMDSLRYWVQEMHVDGFRFDLAPALSRGPDDAPRANTFFDIIQQDPVLARVKLIAEPWDLGPGGYQVGQYPGGWVEWNDKYRDTIRRFWRGDAGQIGELGYRLTGSSDLFAHNGRGPIASLNFVAAHDGFTLRDLVTYAAKHNEANGEGNRDGHDNNLSANYGVEGPTDDPGIRAARLQQLRNFLTTLAISQGVPMLTHGDEVGRTQRGNNNAYCQDSPLTWQSWELDDEARPLLAWTRRVLALRRNHPALRRRTYFQYRPLNGEAPPDILWIQPDGAEMGGDRWGSVATRAVGIWLNGTGADALDARGQPEFDDTFLLLLNAGEEPLDFQLPLHDPAHWLFVLDTSRPDEPEGSAWSAPTYPLAARTVAILRHVAPEGEGLGSGGPNHEGTSTTQRQR